MSNQIELTRCQRKALKLLKGYSNVFLTGAAGTGKSEVIRQFVGNRNQFDYPVLASTGRAALMLEARTFHSYFGLGIVEHGIEAAIHRALQDERVEARIRGAKCIIIDEISMISGELLDAAEGICRKVCGSYRPWGGKRIVIVGDFAQLPPVGTKYWAFMSPAWEESEFEIANLKTMVRSSDPELSKILKQVRLGKLNREVCQFLDWRNEQKVARHQVPHLYPFCVDVAGHNERMLDRLPGKHRAFPTSYWSSAPGYLQSITRYAPMPEELVLKEDALVMLLTNDGQRRWANGSTGLIRSIKKDELEIELQNGKSVPVPKVTFDLRGGNGRVVASAENFPVTLAWATTIHKAQGQTMDRVRIDLRGLWEPGHAYVAMSRVRRAEDLFVKAWIPDSFCRDRNVVKFYRELEDEG